jgi:DNA-directed RNA polymerase subunit F
MRMIGKSSDSSTSVSALEAYLLLLKKDMPKPGDISEAEKSCLAYMKEVSKAKNLHYVEETRRLLQEFGMNEVETSLVMDLSPSKGDECRILVPSLQRFDSSSLDIILTEVSELDMP